MEPPRATAHVPEAARSTPGRRAQEKREGAEICWWSAPRPGIFHGLAKKFAPRPSFFTQSSVRDAKRYWRRFWRELRRIRTMITARGPMGKGRIVEPADAVVGGQDDGDHDPDD